MEETFTEFTNRISRSNKNHKAKVTGSAGVYDLYKLLRKNHWYNIGRPLKEKEFYSIIRGVNRLMADEIANGKTIQFPQRMGALELRKYKVGATLVDGKLRVTYPPDWSETLKLWYEDEEARKNKTILRNNNPYVYYIRFLRDMAIFDNKHFYMFQTNTFIKKALSENIKQGKIDTVW
jgi:hypothetical protein